MPTTVSDSLNMHHLRNEGFVNESGTLSWTLCYYAVVHMIYSLLQTVCTVDHCLTLSARGPTLDDSDISSGSPQTKYL